ncbi:hypothetical protein C8R45DRAFT_946438 [Mycena sanguinolenta]|nr:hypothetical protein C8R45DRAFT_946438 [Mycena sanguinolenta]
MTWQMTRSSTHRNTHIAPRPSIISSDSQLFTGLTTSQPAAHAFEATSPALIPPYDVTTDSHAGLDGSSARGKRGGTVNGLQSQGLSLPLGGRQVTQAVLSVTSDVSGTQTIPLTEDLTLGMERIIPVYAPPWALPLPVSMIIPSKESAVMVVREFLADADYMESTWYGGAWVWVRVDFRGPALTRAKRYQTLKAGGSRSKAILEKISN